MIDRDTGEALAEAKLDAVLEDIFETLSTDGWNRREPGAMGRGKMANRRTRSPSAALQDFDAWEAYAKEFGATTNAMDAMLAHIEGMSRDIAAMDSMGPNPTALLRFQQDWLEKSAGEAKDSKVRKDALNNIHGVNKQLERLYDEYTGAHRRPENRRMARNFAALRSFQTAAKLGGAALSAGGDFGTAALTAGFNRVPVTGMIRRYGSLMNPANMEDRKLAARLGVISDEWSNMTASAERLTGEELGGEVSRRTATFVLRASGLSLHTEAMRMAFAMEALSTVASASDRSFDNLDGGFRRMLERGGIDQAGWDKLRSTALREERGAQWLFPEDIADEGVRDALLTTISREMDFAVPQPDLRTRALINRAPRGNLGGELLRSTFLFKGFPLAILNMHGRRMLEQSDWSSRIGYGVSLMLLTTAGGALSIQAKEIAKGKDPQDMTDPAFWGRAGFQGGGLGIFGDLLGSAVNRFGGGVAQTAAGPMAQTFDNALGLLGNVPAALDFDPETETSWSKDALRLIQHEVPGISLWYTRLALERIALDRLKEWSDPGGYEASLRRLDRYAEEQGTQYFAPPGSGLGGMRAPNFGNALGEGVEMESGIEGGL